MEKMIIELMEQAERMETSEMHRALEEAVINDYPFRYLLKEVLQNELNKRNGTRYISLEKVKKIYEDKQAALS